MEEVVVEAAAAGKKEGMDGMDGMESKCRLWPCLVKAEYETPSQLPNLVLYLRGTTADEDAVVPLAIYHLHALSCSTTVFCGVEILHFLKYILTKTCLFRGIVLERLLYRTRTVQY